MPTFIHRQHPRRVSIRCLREAVNTTLVQEGIRPRAVEISIALVDDAAMRELNARYRGKDSPTDVLSFSQEETIRLPGVPRLLGDIVISVDTAARQAADAGRRLDDEVCHLAIHGILHLLGYDDATAEGYAEMVEKGEQIWRGCRCATVSAGQPADDQSDGQ